MDDDAASGLELQLLGPVRLCRAGQPQLLKTRKALALLVLLVLDGPMSRLRLCGWLWPRLDEQSARRNLRRELARLREVGAGDALHADGELLSAAPALVCDLLRAEALLAGGDPEAALALWQGGMGLEGFEAGDDDEAGFANWLALQCQRARALQRQVLEAAAAAAEFRGDLGLALARVQSLLHADGLHERHHREAMRLLAATGQREAALRQFQACCTLLDAELGVQPMPETLALAQSLRHGAPSAAHAAPVAAAAPDPGAVQLPPQLPFVGREAEVARMQRAWDRRQAIVLVGEAGIGKTRLATDFAAAHGAYALLRCQGGDGELPLAAFARALRVLAGQPADLRGLEPWVQTELARLLPELGAAPPPLRHPDDRLRFDEACARAWQVLADEAFDAVVLDDWQLADPASCALLARVAARRRERGGAGALELLAWRGDAEDGALQTLAEALAAETLTLAPLPQVAVHALVRQLSGVAEPVRFAQRLSDSTGGHPFFIAETLRDLAERNLLLRDAEGRWHTPFDMQTQDYRELPLPASVRDAVLGRVRRLGAPAARLLEAAALAGEPLRPAWLAAACALSELEALAALGDAAQAHLVVARDGGGYGWTHDLARVAMVSSLAPTRARLVHHRLALAAEAGGAHVDAALHFEAASEAARAVPHRLAAGDAARALHALNEAAAQWHQGLADGPEVPHEAALLARLCGAEWLLGHADAAHVLHERLQALLPQPMIGPDARAESQLHAARYLLDSGRAADAMALLDQIPVSLALPLHQRWRIERMGALHQCGRMDEALAEGLAALQAAAAGSREQAEVLASLATIEHSRGQMRAAVARADASVALFARLGDANARARGVFMRGAMRVELGEDTAGAADLREAAALAARQGNVHLQRIALYNLAAVYSNQTRPDEALAVAQEAWPSLSASPRVELALMFRAMFIECHHVRGDWGSMWEHLVPAVEHALAGARPMTMIGVAFSALEPAAALNQWHVVQPLVQALDARLLDDVPVAAEIMLGCTQAALIMGDTAAAAAWLARVPAAGQLENPRVRCRALLLRAELALAAGAGTETLSALEALAALPADDAPGMTTELRLRALTLHCRAGADPTAPARALAALSNPAAHAGAALVLARVLGDPAYAARRHQLAGSLARFPTVRDSFLAAWR